MYTSSSFGEAPSSTLNGTSSRSSRIRTPIRDITGRGGGSRAVEAGGRRGCRPSARLRRRRWHDGVGCWISAALAPARPVGDSGASVVRVGSMVARDRCCGCRCGSRCSGGRRSWQPFPRGGKVVDAALIVEAGVRSKVGLDICIAVGGTLDLVAGLIDGAGHEGVLVVLEILLDGGAEEVEVLGVVARARISFASKVASKDLFLEAVKGVGDALKVFKIGHCAGDSGILRARSEDSVACALPVGGRNVRSGLSISLLLWTKDGLMLLTV